MATSHRTLEIIRTYQGNKWAWCLLFCGLSTKEGGKIIMQERDPKPTALYSVLEMRLCSGSLRVTTHLYYGIKCFCLLGEKSCYHLMSCYFWRIIGQTPSSSGNEYPYRDVRVVLMNKNSLGGVSHASVQISCSTSDYQPCGGLLAFSCSIGGITHGEIEIRSELLQCLRSAWETRGPWAWHCAICCVSHISFGVNSNGAQVELSLILFCLCLNTS